MCATESYSFAVRADRSDALYAGLIGMPVDQVFSHLRWAAWIGEKLGLEIPFPHRRSRTRTRAEEYDCYDWWFCHKQLEE